MKEASVVMVVNEETKGIKIGEVRSLSVVTLLDLTHISAIAENIVNCIVHRVVKKASD